MLPPRAGLLLSVYSEMGGGSFLSGEGWVPPALRRPTWVWPAGEDMPPAQP